MVLSLERWLGKVAVVTGASSGIGAAIVEKLVEHGLVVVGLARRLERLRELQQKFVGKKGHFHPFKCDITQDEEVIETFKHITENIGPIHILINNAGIVYMSELTQGEPDKWRQMFNTNVIGLCVATKEAVKDMKKNDVDGHIIHINSVAGHYIPGLPQFNIYPASKHVVTVLTENLRQEMAREKRKIKVTSLSPGLVMTEIFDKSNDTVKAAVSQMPAIAPEEIAESIVYVLSTPPNVDISELTIRPVNELTG